jgi:hypothetical protein
LNGSKGVLKLKRGLVFGVALIVCGAIVMLGGMSIGAAMPDMPAASVGPTYTFPPTTINPSGTVALDSTVNIPDANLKAKLQAALGLTASSSPKKSDLAKITGGLDLSGASIAKIEGLQYCTNVTDIKLSNNKIDDKGIPSTFTGLTNLKTLLLDGNKLTKVPTSVLAMTGLTYLSLAGNQIKTIPDNISALAALVNLDLSGNALTTLPANIGTLQNLQYLNLSDNNFRDATREIFLLPALTTLDLSGNVLDSLPDDAAKMPELQALDVEGNILTALPAGLGNAQSLQKVYAARNRLTTIEPTLLNGKITDLTLDVNRLTTLPIGLSGKTFNTFSVEWNFLDMSQGSDTRQIADSVTAPGGKAYLRQLKSIPAVQTQSSIKTVTLQWLPVADGSDGDGSWKVNKYQIYQVNGDSWKLLAELDKLAGQFVVTGLDAEKTYDFQVGVEYDLTIGSYKASTRFFTPAEAKTLSATATVGDIVPIATGTPQDVTASSSPEPADTVAPEPTGSEKPASTQHSGNSSGGLIAVIIVGAVLILGVIGYLAMRMSRKQRY